MDATNRRLDALASASDRGGDSSVGRLVYDVSHVPDHPTRSLRSGHKRDRADGGGCNVAFSAGLPGCSSVLLVQVSQLLSLNMGQ